MPVRAGDTAVGSRCQGGPRDDVGDLLEQLDGVGDATTLAA
jgi:hypothetical protein